MLPTMNHDPEIQFGAEVQGEIKEQSRNDKYHTTSNTEQNTSTKGVQQENKEHNGTRPLSRCYHDKMILESLLNQFKSESSFLGRRTYPDI